MLIHSMHQPSRSSVRTARLELSRAAFTLIEVLTVIAIIGILVGLLLPAVSAARRYVAQNTLVINTKTLADAVEAYKTEFGEYPPDGSSRAVFMNHFRKAFPNMAPTEFTILFSVANNDTGGLGSAGQGVTYGSNPTGMDNADTVMSPAEALVFCLGGFSNDPIRPFTGSGGPLSTVPGSNPVIYQYNVDRENELFEFKDSQLSLFVDTSGSAPRTISDDEDLTTGAVRDAMPVYRPSGQLAPYVYFDARTYSFPYGNQHFFNSYFGAGFQGYARPYKADDVNTNVAVPSATSPYTVKDAYSRYANVTSFQIICAGIDDDFGGIQMPAQSAPVFFRFPSGEALNISDPTQVGNGRYQETSGVPSPQLDNATNFADGILENGLAN